MAEDPYAPPKSTVADPGNERQGSFVKAILVALAVDIGGTFAASILLSVMVGVVMGSAGNTAEETAELFARSLLLKTAMMVIGIGCTVLGGYVAGRIANRTELNVALMFGVCTLIAGELLSRWMGNNPDGWEQAVFLVLTIPAAVFGGWLYKRRKRPAADRP
jgi:hypothetical protein